MTEQAIPSSEKPLLKTGLQEYEYLKTELEMGSNYYIGWLISTSLLAALFLYMAL